MLVIILISLIRKCITDNNLILSDLGLGIVIVK